MLVYPETSRICSDGGKQYYGLHQLFRERATCFTTNHSIGEFVEESSESKTFTQVGIELKELELE